MYYTITYDIRFDRATEEEDCKRFIEQNDLSNWKMYETTKTVGFTKTDNFKSERGTE